MIQVRADRALERWHAGKRPAANARARDVQKPALHQIQPRGAGGHEMKVHAGMASEPPADRRTLVRAQIVQNEVQVLTLRCRSIEPPQESHKLPTAVAPSTL